MIVLNEIQLIIKSPAIISNITGIKIKAKSNHSFLKYLNIDDKQITKISIEKVNIIDDKIEIVMIHFYVKHTQC